MMESQTRLIRKAECNGSGKTSGGLLVGRRRIDEIVPSSHNELVGVLQIDEDVRIVFKWYFTFEKLERLIVHPPIHASFVPRNLQASLFDCSIWYSLYSLLSPSESWHSN
jgi:hypothetical protein